MKKLFFGSMAIAVLAMVGCSNENDLLLDENTQEVFSGEILTESSRTSMGEGGKTLWSDGDAINLFKKTGYYQKYLVAEGGSTTANFTYGNVSTKGNAHDQHYAVYPYAEANTINSNNSINVDLSGLANQTYAEGTFDSSDALMVAKSATTALPFTNTLSMARVNIRIGGSVIDATVDKVMFTSTSAALTGTATVDMTQEKPAAVITGEGKVIELVTTDAVALSAEPIPFYVLIPAGEYAEGTLKLTINAIVNGEPKELTKEYEALNFQRSVIETFDIEITEDGDWTGTTDDVIADVEVASAEDLQTALANAEDGLVIFLANDIELSESLTFGAPTVRSASTTYAGCDIVIDGKGKTISFTQQGTGRMIDFTNETNGANLTLKNVTLLNKASYMQRGVNYNTNGTLTLDNVTIKSEGNPISYAINLPGNSDNAKVVINNSSLEGCIALNVWGEGVNVTADGSSFTTIDNASHEGYSVIALNNDGITIAKNSTINITGGSINVTGNETNNSILTSNATLDGKITISATTACTEGFTHFTPDAIVVFSNTDDFYSCSSLQEAIDTAVERAGSVKLIKNVTLTKAIVVKTDNTVTVDLNGCDVTATSTDVFEVQGTLTINGTDESVVYAGSEPSNTGSVCAVWANGGTVTINGGYYKVGQDKDGKRNDCIYAGSNANVPQNGKITINSGKFEYVGTSAKAEGQKFLINCADKATTAKITVNGGSFKNHVPSYEDVTPSGRTDKEVVLGTSKAVYNGDTAVTTAHTGDTDIWYTVK